MPSIRSIGSALALALATRSAAQSTLDCSGDNVCQSFGVDFVSDGTYFQNINSTDPFTAVQEFTGCQNDTANNVLVDPNGDQYLCTDTPLTPDSTPESLSCGIDKDELYTGEWSLIIISNNGDACPIAYERDFSLTVGPQATSTVTPTVTVQTAYTPVVNATLTSTVVVTVTAKTSTVTVPAYNLQATVTSRPAVAYATARRAALTFTSTTQVVKVVATSTVMVTASCSSPAARRQHPDPVATVIPHVLGAVASSIASELGITKRDAAPAPTARSGSTEFKRALVEGRAIDAAVQADFVLQRRERMMALNKRAPDAPTVTVTETTAVVTVTSTTATAAAITLYAATTTSTSTFTTTPLTTVSKGAAVGVYTVTASQSTSTVTSTVSGAVTVVTSSPSVTLTVTSKTTPAALAASCSSIGGVLS